MRPTRSFLFHCLEIREQLHRCTPAMLTLRTGHTIQWSSLSYVRALRALVMVLCPDMFLYTRYDGGLLYSLQCRPPGHWGLMQNGPHHHLLKRPCETRCTAQTSEARAHKGDARGMTMRGYCIDQMHAKLGSRFQFANSWSLPLSISPYLDDLHTHVQRIGNSSTPASPGRALFSPSPPPPPPCFSKPQQDTWVCIEVAEIRPREIGKLTVFAPTRSRE